MGITRTTVQWGGLVAGPVLAVLCYALLPEQYREAEKGQLVEFTAAGRATLAVMVWMAAWWLTEAIDISATALLPIALFPLLGAASIAGATAPYAHPLIFLFMGGFLLALSMQRWGLDRRIALITLRIVGTRPISMVGGFMIATAVMSAFVSNTATAAMMLPIALSVTELLRRGDSGQATDRNFALCLMLGIAYAASIGGLATIIGTPPNAYLVGFLRDSIAADYRLELSFARWMLIGVPLSAVLLPITWLLLTRLVYPVGRARIEGGRELIERSHAALGPVGRGEWATFIVFMCTATCWILRPLLIRIDLAPGEAELRPLGGLTDSGIAILAGLVLFVIPIDPRRRVFALDWQTARKLPWGILILFGGGLSLAKAVEHNGVAEFIGTHAAALGGASPLILVLVVTTLVIFLTELTSNTATTATLVPVLAAVAGGAHVHPYLLVFPAAIAASCAFMMPVATPPNAIVFGSGFLTIPQMCRAGLWLNLICIGLITTLVFLLIGPLLGI